MGRVKRETLAATGLMAGPETQAVTEHLGPKEILVEMVRLDDRDPTA